MPPLWPADIDLMGFIQMCGVSVSPVMYISLVMSIGTNGYIRPCSSFNHSVPQCNLTPPLLVFSKHSGLMVDYVMHVTYRYMVSGGWDCSWVV